MIDSGVGRPQLGASAPLKNGKDLTFKGVNGLALIVGKLNLRMLLIHFEPQIRQLQNWGSDNRTSPEESTQQRMWLSRLKYNVQGRYVSIYLGQYSLM